jgi:UV excision repair protein RAD23
MDRDRASGPAGGAAGAAGLPSLEEIANSPQMARIREAVQDNPALIQPLLQQIANTNPALANMINQDPHTLYELLGLSEEDIAGGDYEGPQVMQVNLTDDEVAAVERLEQLGFPRQMVLQAFLLCDKNEELAANFLFESTEEDEQMQ